MLWCKETFEQHFDDQHCRLFPIQQQLFDFVDAAAAKQGDRSWLCFSIEFPSASEVSRLLSRHSAGRREVTLFRRKELLGDAHGATIAAADVVRKRPREDFALLYGEAPLSQQNRMFLAVTLVGLRAVLATIDARQLHLYEIIREGSPCHLYLDVEREGNYVGLHMSVSVDDDESSNSSCVVADDSFVRVVEGKSEKKSRTLFQCSAARYKELCHRAAGAVPSEVCGLDCPVEPDNEKTCEVLLRELAAFVQERFPSLVRSVDGATETGNSGSIFEEVWVLESVPLSGATTKFSQHYVIKFANMLFESTSSVKAFVRQFVAHLSDRAVKQCSVHRSLFFHGSPAWYGVFRELSLDYPRNTLPYLPRKCVVDEAVYSKNRVMRCLGSCKLGKTSVLRVHRHYLQGRRQSIASNLDACAPPTLEVFLATLISSHLPVTAQAAARIFRVDNVAIVSGSGVGTNAPMTAVGAAKSMGAAHWQAVSSDEDDTTRNVALLLETAYAQISHAECTMMRPRQLHGRFLTFQVSGTRYCQHIAREHKSNNVYLVVDLEKRTFVQKCFDPDCASYRSPPLPLDNSQHNA